VLTGANYSPHHLALYYGPVFQWVDNFKHGGMSMHWAEDYIFSVPEAPSSNPGSDLQVRSWDISSPANLANPALIAELGTTWMPIEAHGYFKNGDWLQIGENYDFNLALEP